MPDDKPTTRHAAPKAETPTTTSEAPPPEIAKPPAPPADYDPPKLQVRVDYAATVERAPKAKA